MPQTKLAGTVKLYWEAMRRSGQHGLPMRLRLFGFLVLFLNAIMLGVLLILYSTGLFRAGLSEHRRAWEVELTHRAQNVYKSFGAISVQTVDLAKELSMSIERNLLEHGSSASQLQANPYLLEHLLDDELKSLTGALEKSRASGVFLLLDATVNPMLPNAADSRACVYLKNMEPNIVNRMDANLRYALGPMSIARNNAVQILPQWEMEMDTGTVPYFKDVMATARESRLALSRLYRWSEATILPNSSERIMLCAAPLIAADGTVFGLCGFEISEMLFKLTHTPLEDSYNQVFCALSPLENNRLRLAGALFSRGFVADPNTFEDAPYEIAYHEGSFHAYQRAEKESFAGLHQPIALYPTDSAYANEQWVLALMMPEPALNALLSAKNRSLTLGLFALMLVNIGLASFISRKYIHPVMAALEQLKKPNPTKTRIPEIDDLIEFLAAQDEAPLNIEEKLSVPNQSYLRFMENIKMLSPAEKAVFDLYVEGYKAKEIAAILCLSINTIKTHNRRIYMKLNVSSRKELMVYVNMMKETQERTAP